MQPPRRLARKRVTPAYGQVELGDPYSPDYPQWEHGNEPAVANDRVVAIATKPEHEGDVEMELWEGELEAPKGLVEIFRGELDFSDDLAQIGTLAGDDVETVPISPGTHRVVAYVDEAGYAERIVFALEPG
jgi:hypothetical protein